MRSRAKKWEEHEAAVGVEKKEIARFYDVWEAMMSLW